MRVADFIKPNLKTGIKIMIEKSVFPVGLEREAGYVCGQNGTGFLLNFAGYRLVLTDLHCIPEEWKSYGRNILKKYIEDHIFFGMIPNTPNIWRIPICNIFYHMDDIGNFLDLLICAVDEKDVSAVCEQTSLNDILSLELSNRDVRLEQYYRIYGYPTREFKKNGASYRSVGHEIQGKLTKRHIIKDDSNNVFDIPSSVYPIEVCEIEIVGNSYGGHGFSGSPVVDEENKVVGIIFGCSADFQTFYFFPNNILQAVLSKVVVKLEKNAGTSSSVSQDSSV